MAIVLWGRSTSANVQKALWALEELGLDYENVPLAGRFGGNQTPDYLAMNPNGLVPTLRDGELVVWESHAIVRYLCARYGSGALWPIDPDTRSVVDQWTDWVATTFQPAWIDAFWRVVRTPVEQRDPAAIDRAVAATNRCFSILGARLERTPYLGGEVLTYADIVAGVAMYRWSTMDVSRDAVPSVEAWHGRLRKRAAYRQAVEVSYEELVGRLTF